MPLFWRTAGDDRVCDHCAALDGKREGDGWSFTKEPGPGGPPPLHPNCRCQVVHQPTPDTPPLTAEDFVSKIAKSDMKRP